MQDADKNKDTSKSEDSEWDSSHVGDNQRLGTEFGIGALFAPLPAEFLLERGYCCGNGCKNCPYDYKAVPEPRRSKLLEQRKKDQSNK